MNRRLPFFYGWAIVGAVFFILMVTAGLGFYNASVILSAAAEELDASVGTVSAGPALFFGISGVTGFALSKQMETVDIRWFYLAGGIVGSAALYGLRAVESVIGYYFFFFVFGIGFALAGLVPSTTLVARWFAVKRSVALSIASTGLSVGGILLTPVAARLIHDQTLSGASTEMSIAWFVGVVPIALLVLRSNPASIGLQADGAPTPRKSVAAVGATLAEAVKTRFFKYFSVTFALIFLAQVGAIAHLFNLTKERVDASAAGTALSILALSSVIGRLAGGVVVMRVPTKSLAAILTLLQAGALALIAVSFSRTTIFISSSVFGLSVGNLLMLQPLLVAEAFGVKEYSRVYSLSQLIGTLGVAGGPFLLGALHDQTSYQTAFIVAASANVIGFGLLFLAGPTVAAQKSWDHSDLKVTLT